MIMNAAAQVNKGPSLATTAPYRFGTTQLDEKLWQASIQFFTSATPYKSAPLQGPLSTSPNPKMEIIINMINNLGLFFEALATRPGSGRISPDKLMS